jgi:hypothetical protein
MQTRLARLPQRRWLLDLDADPKAIDEQLSQDGTLRASVERARGRREPRTVDGGEMAVRAAELRMPSRQSGAETQRPDRIESPSGGHHMFKRDGFVKRAKSKVPDLEEDEDVLASWIASIPFSSKSGRAAKTGGTLVLTNTRVLFEPLGATWKLPSTRHTHGISGGIKFTMKRLIRADRGCALLSEIARVEALPERGAPRLRITSNDGFTADYAVVASRSSTPFGDQSENIQLRDDAVSKIKSLLKSSGHNDAEATSA